MAGDVGGKGVAANVPRSPASNDVTGPRRFKRLNGDCEQIE